MHVRVVRLESVNMDCLAFGLASARSYACVERPRKSHYPEWTTVLQFKFGVGALWWVVQQHLLIEMIALGFHFVIVESSVFLLVATMIVSGQLLQLRKFVCQEMMILWTIIVAEVVFRQRERRGRLQIS